MKHMLDVDNAIRYGVLESILIEYFRFWVASNMANKTNFHDGRYWTYNSVSAYSELFPYVSYDKIRRALDNLKNCGVLVTGVYNKDPRDRTLWYSLSDDFIDDIKNYSLHLADLQNARCKNHRPLPYNKQSDIRQYNNNPLSVKTDIPQGEGCCVVEEVDSDEQLFEQFRKMYKGTKRGHDKEFTNFKKKHSNWREITRKLIPAYEHQLQLRDEGMRNGCFVPQEQNLQTWINNDGWEYELQFQQDSRTQQQQSSFLDTLAGAEQMYQSGMWK